jgi:hypothetical protein
LLFVRSPLRAITAIIEDGTADPAVMLAVAVVLLGGSLAWLFLRSRHDFVLKSANGIVTIRGKFPPGHRQYVIDFLSSAPGAVKVTGRWTSRGELRLSVSAPSAGERQRVRNYLMATMRPG